MWIAGKEISLKAATQSYTRKIKTVRTSGRKSPQLNRAFEEIL